MVMMASPFPHVHARAAQGAAAKIAKKNEAWELFRTGCWRAGVLIVCCLAATFVYQVAVARREGRLNFNLGSSMVRKDGSPLAMQDKDKFFLDIASSTDAMHTSMNGRHLEKKGWTGVCAVPVAGDLAGRSCKVVALPLGAKDGSPVHVTDCSRNMMGLQGLMNMVMKVGCEQVPATTVSIGKLLAIASAPKVIDYVSIDHQANVTEIMHGFPFNEHCVRAWSIKGLEDILVGNLRNLLEVAQGCRIHTEGQQIWARCPCEKKKSNRGPVAHKKSASMAAVEVSASGHGKHRSASTPLAVDHPAA